MYKNPCKTLSADEPAGSLHRDGSAWEKSDVAQITALAYALLASAQTGWFAQVCWLMAALHMLRSVVSHVR